MSPQVTRNVLAVTGSRAEYGAMRPVLKALAAHAGLKLGLIVIGMHLDPRFAASRGEIERDGICPLHLVHTPHEASEDMALTLSAQIASMVPVMAQVAPDVVLVQGDRGEMLAATIVACHRNIAVAHMSGGDRSGSIDDSIRNAITSFAHLHLTTCGSSTQRLIARGEAPQRVFEVGEPALDVIHTLEPVPAAQLAVEFRLDLSRPFALATQHPVTTEVQDAAAQVSATLQAIEELGLQTVFTYPNTDHGGADIVRILENWRGHPLLRLVPHLGQRAYFSLMRIASVMIGNSSSGIIEAASFHLPVVNIGTRQTGRQRAANVIDAGYDTAAIKQAVHRALRDRMFRRSLQTVVNPYGDGTTAARTVDVLARLRVTPELLTKWREAPASFVD